MSSIDQNERNKNEIGWQKTNTSASKKLPIKIETRSVNGAPDQMNVNKLFLIYFDRISINRCSIPQYLSAFGVALFVQTEKAENEFNSSWVINDSYW